MADSWSYEKLDENNKVKRIFNGANDPDGKITGHIVINVKAWMDENPEERKRLGWIKHITHDAKAIEYNHQTQYLLRAQKPIDEYTIEDEFFIMDKSEEMMRAEEVGSDTWFWSDADAIVVNGEGVMGI